MKHDSVAIVAMCLVWFVLGAIIALSARTHYIEPLMLKRYQPTQMQYAEFDTNTIIFHGPAKITFLDPNMFEVCNAR